MTAARRLSAILAADVVGYSRLMGEDEVGTARAVRDYRAAAAPIVRGLGGRLVKTMGDGALLEFPSVVAAVECAILMHCETNFQTALCGASSTRNDLFVLISMAPRGSAMAGTRKIAAILVADVVGYSRLAGADEDRTLSRLRGLRSDLIDPAIDAHRGRIVKRTGDGALIEFRSVVDAVGCAIEVQNGLIERNAGLARERRIEFRVGIHLGDVVEESDGDLMGDGVNIASRLEGLAEPGGVCLSNAAYEQVRDRLKVEFIDLGEKELKNIARPVRVYRVNMDREATGSEPSARERPEARLALPDKPSIAVLPFQNMSGDPEQDYFADGMVEDIVTGLSRIKWLFVIARNSSFVYKGKAVDVRQVGRELGVRYVLEGGVRKAGLRVRITAQLVEAETGAHLWADKFDGGLEDVFDLQDQITDRVVGIVEPSLRKSEIDRSRRKRPESLDAYDLFLRALPCLVPISNADAPVAAGLLRDALETGPELPRRSCLSRVGSPDCLRPRRVRRSRQNRRAPPRARGDRQRRGRRDRARCRRDGDWLLGQGRRRRAQCHCARLVA